MAVAASAVAPRRARGRLALVPAIAVESASRSFGPVTALDRVSLDVAPGEVHALLGPAGAGKTTLLRLLAGLEVPDDGRVTLLGEPAGRPGSRGRVGYLPAGGGGLYERLSGEENLLFFARLLGLGRAEARTRARELIVSLGLAEEARRPIAGWPEDMRGRLAFARAVLASPAVLLLDEDAADVPSLRAPISELVADGVAVVVATARLEALRDFADRATVLVAGRARHTGSAGALLARADGSRYVVRLAGSRCLAELQDVLGPTARLTAAGATGRVLVELCDGTVLGDVLSMLAAAGARVRDCRNEAVEGEDAFLALAVRART